MSLLTKFLIAILLIAILAVVVSKSSATAGLIQTASSTFAKMLGIIVSPIGGAVNHTTQFSAPK